MSKFLVQGRDAGRLLNQFSANDVDGDAGVITYTQWLNEAGTLEADLTVTKLDDEQFWVVATDTAHRHVETRMRRHFGDPRDRHRRHRRPCAVQRARPAFTRVGAVDHLGRSLERGVPVSYGTDDRRRLCPRLCVRITYLGELGYELYVPAEQAAHVYDRLSLPARPSVCATPASRRWPACGWRRATATTATTSTTPTRCSKPGSGSPSTSTSPAGSSGATPSLPRRPQGR